METKEKIYKAAKESFIENGFHATGMREIAKKANVTPSNTYKHYSNKDELIRLIVEDFNKEVVEGIEYLVSYEITKNSLKEFFLSYIKEGVKDHSIRLTMEIYSEALRNKNILNIVKHSEELLISSLEEAFSQSSLKLKLSNRDTARLLFTTADSLSFKTKTEKGLTTKKALEAMTEFIEVIM